MEGASGNRSHACNVGFKKLSYYNQLQAQGENKKKTLPLLIKNNTKSLKYY